MISIYLALLPQSLKIITTYLAVIHKSLILSYLIYSEFGTDHKSISTRAGDVDVARVARNDATSLRTRELRLTSTSDPIQFCLHAIGC